MGRKGRFWRKALWVQGICPLRPHVPECPPDLAIGQGAFPCLLDLDSEVRIDVVELLARVPIYSQLRERGLNLSPRSL